MDGFAMWKAGLARASSSWGEASEGLAEVRRQLGLAQDETTELGETVAAAVTTWLETWIEEARRLEELAGQFSEDLDTAWRSQAEVDAETAAGLRALMPYDDQSLAPMPRGVV